MGFGKLRQWFTGKTLLTRNLINERPPYKIIPAVDGIFDLPTFQYSIIPRARQYITTSENSSNFPVRSGIEIATYFKTA